MNINLIFNINQNPIQKQFLRENSYWYKYLNRDSNYYKDFINEMKKKYKMTTSDKINKVAKNINLIHTFLDVLK